MRRGTYRALIGGGGFTPAQLNPVFWIEARRQEKFFQSNAGTTAVTDTSVCGFATDLSNNAFDVSSVADDTTRPSWNFNSGLSYLAFDGTNDLLRRTADIGSYAAGSASWFCSTRCTTAAQTKYPMVMRNSASTNAVYSMCFEDSNVADTLDGFIRNDAGTALLSNIQTLKSGAFDNTDHVIGVVDDGVRATAYVDGVAAAPFTYTARTGTLTLDRFCVGGSLSTSAANFYTGRIYGAIAVNRALSFTEVRKLTTYFGKLYGGAL